MQPLDPQGTALFEGVLKKWEMSYPGVPYSDDMLGHLHGVFCFMYDRWTKIKSALPDDMSRNLNLVNDADKVIEMELVEEAGITGLIPACGNGCSYCCKSEKIVANPIEIRSILFEVLGMPDSKRAPLVKQILSSTQTESVNQGARGAPCAMLVNNQCSIYSVRPMACRGYFSAAAKQCEDRLGGVNLVVSGFPLARFVEYTANALINSGAQMMEYEINSILKMLFSDTNLREQWKAGNMKLGPESMLEYMQLAYAYRTS